MKSARRLLPFERWIADVGDAQGKKASNSELAYRQQRNYGPEGVRLLAAGMLDALVGGTVALAGALLRAFARDSLAVVVTGYGVLAIGLIILMLAAARGVQGGRSGKAHRGDQPFLRLWDG